MYANFTVPILTISSIIFIYRRTADMYPYKQKVMGVLFLLLSLLVGVLFIPLEIMNLLAGHGSLGNASMLIAFFAVIVAIDSSIVDLEYKEIPNVSNVSIAVLGIMAALASGRSVLEFLLPAAVIFALFLLLASLGGSMGGGDVKMAAAVGFFIPLNLVLPFLLVTFGAGTAAGIYEVLVKKKGRDYHIAFGPYIALSFTVLAFYRYFII